MTVDIFVVYLVINGFEYPVKAFYTQEAAEKYVENKKSDGIYNIDILTLEKN